MIDADGWVKNDRNMLTFGLASTLEFMNECQRILMENCDLNKTKLWQSNQTSFLYNMYYGGNLQGLRIAKFLYTDNEIWLPRKKIKAINQLYKRFPKDEWVNYHLTTLNKLV